jgi:DNA repair protein RadD
MMLRDYQQRSINQLYDWLSHNSGNPCLVLPTGAGKSHVIAALCKDALQSWPETRILMLTHVKELIEQNAQKMRQHWPNAPMGIYSAGMGQKILGEPITFAGIQSIRKHADQVGHVDLVIIDECHLVNHNDEGGYRTFLSDIYRTNPNVRVIGLTASPYRLGHGYIIEKPAIFDN